LPIAAGFSPFKKGAVAKNFIEYAPSRFAMLPFFSFKAVVWVRLFYETSRAVCAWRRAVILRFWNRGRSPFGRFQRFGGYSTGGPERAGGAAGASSLIALLAGGLALVAWVGQWTACSELRNRGPLFAGLALFSVVAFLGLP
jgi:hypothetical protein